MSDMSEWRKWAYTIDFMHKFYILFLNYES